MRGANKLIALICLMLLLCCKDNNAAEDEVEIRERYFNLEKVGWKSHEHVQEVSDITYKASEVPVAFYILNKEGMENLFKVDSIEKANNRERIIEFDFSEIGENDLLKEGFTGMSQDDAVKYLSFSIQDDFYAVTSKMDTIPCSGVLYERNFGVRPDCKLLLFFGNINPEEKIQLVYNDRLFGKGVLKFKFEETIIREEL